MKYILKFLLLLLLPAVSLSDSKVNSEEPPSTEMAVHAEADVNELLSEESSIAEGKIEINYEDLKKILSVKETNQANIAMIDVLFKSTNIFSTKEIEEKIVRPFEGALSGVEEIEHIYSISKNNSAKITIQFKEKVEYPEALNIIKKAVDSASNGVFPKGIEKPEIKKSEIDKEIVKFTLWSESIKNKELNTIVFQVKEEICQSFSKIIKELGEKEEYPNNLNAECYIENNNTIVLKEVSQLSSKTKIDIAEKNISKINAMKGTVIPDTVHVEISRNYGETAKEKIKTLLGKFQKACEKARKESGITENIEPEQLLEECFSLLNSNIKQ